MHTIQDLIRIRELFFPTERNSMNTVQDIIDNPDLIREYMYEVIDRKYDIDIAVTRDSNFTCIDILIPVPEEFYSGDRLGSRIMMTNNAIEQNCTNVLQADLDRLRREFEKSYPYLLNDETLLDNARWDAREEMLRSLRRLK